MSQQNESFWSTRWESVIARSPLRRRRANDPAGLKRWNQRAAGFAKNSQADSAIARRKATLAMLIKEGALFSGARVLDIGAGPGAWALALAEAGAIVTALEPADAMADLLESHIGSAGTASITVVRNTWQAVDLDAMGWRGAFDLAFASMTPGIDGPANLHKMIAASRRFCYLSAFAGRGWQRWYAELWQEFFDEPMGEPAHDIIHPFNLLYAMGYRPNLSFSYLTREHSLPRDEAMEDLGLFLETHMELTPNVKERLAQFVDHRCQDGRLIRKQNACQGAMLWDITMRDAAA